MAQVQAKVPQTSSSESESSGADESLPAKKPDDDLWIVLCQLGAMETPTKSQRPADTPVLADSHATIPMYGAALFGDEHLRYRAADPTFSEF
jgi:hypothetical protein